MYGRLFPNFWPVFWPALGAKDEGIWLPAALTPLNRAFVASYRFYHLA